MVRIRPGLSDDRPEIEQGCLVRSTEMNQLRVEVYAGNGHQRGR
jgi:hypothetical protein